VEVSQRAQEVVADANRFGASVDWRFDRYRW